MSPLLSLSERPWRFLPSRLGLLDAIAAARRILLADEPKAAPPPPVRSRSRNIFGFSAAGQ
ncbi:MAG TPA: hypothetical protein VFL96_00795 [Acidobacteriaceae bacterium]|nr:hypothetical protein [Acidobacteriaceae bacterium]